MRHLFLIRHGQYDLDAETPEKRILTALGELNAWLSYFCGLPFKNFMLDPPTSLYQFFNVSLASFAAICKLNFCRKFKKVLNKSAAKIGKLK